MEDLNTTRLNVNLSIGLHSRIITAIEFGMKHSVYTPVVTVKELNTTQMFVLALFHGLLCGDIAVVITLLSIAPNLPQLMPSFISVWLRDNFRFLQKDVAKVLSTLAQFIEDECSVVPPSILATFGGLEEKYDIFNFFKKSGDTKGQLMLAFLNPLVSRGTQTEPDGVQDQSTPELKTTATQTTEEEQYDESLADDDDDDDYNGDGSAYDDSEGDCEDYDDGGNCEDYDDGGDCEDYDDGGDCEDYDDGGDCEDYDDDGDCDDGGDCDAGGADCDDGGDCEDGGDYDDGGDCDYGGDCEDYDDGGDCDDGGDEGCNSEEQHVETLVDDYDDYSGDGGGEDYDNGVGNDDFDGGHDYYDGGDNGSVSEEQYADEYDDGDGAYGGGDDYDDSDND